MVQDFNVDLEEYKRFVETHEIIEGTYLAAYLRHKGLARWIGEGVQHG